MALPTAMAWELIQACQEINYKEPSFLFIVTICRRLPSIITNTVPDKEGVTQFVAETESRHILWHMAPSEDFTAMRQKCSDKQLLSFYCTYGVCWFHCEGVISNRHYTVHTTCHMPVSSLLFIMTVNRGHTVTVWDHSLCYYQWNNDWDDCDAIQSWAYCTHSE